MISPSRCATVALLLLFALSPKASPAEDATNAPLTFEKDIRPILREHCFDCHGATEEKEAGLDLRLVRFQQAGGDSGPAIVPGDAEGSLFLQRIRSGEMPPGEAKVSAEEIALIERWISVGAPTARPEPETIGPGVGVTPEDRAWWAFQPIARPAVPETGDPSVRTPIDALLRAAMPDGLHFSEDADRLTLLKRACFDLTGLPPSQELRERFLADESANAYPALIEELLDSPHYGERWARHWLDVAGYADSEGATNQDAVRTWAYKYRDYVIRSFNSDKPFDRFIHEQLAGDELAGPIEGDLTDEQIELLTATGFLRMAADGTGSGDNSPEARNQVIADTLKIVSTSLLGMTVACAQCHDHRYDPILQTDYYALRAVFEPALDWQNWKTPQQRVVSLYTQADRQKAAEIEAEAQKVAAERAEKQAVYIAEALEKELSKYEEPLRGQLKTAYETPDAERTDEQKQLLAQNPSVNISPGVLYQYNQAAADELKKYDERIAEIRAGKPVEEFMRVLSEPPGHVPETRLFHRGDYRQPTDTVAPAALTVTSPEGEQIQFRANSEELPTTGRRLEFARWLTSRDNPLTARVIVNRIWLHHFGRGLVETPADFGRLGMPPTHPDLLDWLADEFIAQGWSLKELHRQIMLSTVYRQSSYRDPEQSAIDAENHSYWRQNVTRLDAEILTDRVLATTGELDPTLYGPPVSVMEDDAGQVIVDGQKRRSLYVQQRRTQPVALLETFDAPVMQTNCELRPSSTVATQSLMLMNGRFLLVQSAKLATRARTETVTELPAELAAVVGSFPEPLPPLWQFGYGGFDPESNATSRFTPLPHWTGSAWQGGGELPDPKLGWVILHANGGHTGANPDFCAIRRWTAPADGILKVNGTLHHSNENGDGVRGRIVVAGQGLAGEWPVQNSEAATAVESINVSRGDTVDFITDCREHVTSDSFSWTVELTLTADDTTIGTWKSDAGFHGPTGPRKPLHPGDVVRAWQLAYLRAPTQDELNSAVDFLQGQLAYLHAHPESLSEGTTPEDQALTNLCQALMSSNEFLYVD
ncbi:MAG: DUF1553 domain-containing protein [Planctomycetota bacterium]|nr:MAG: DUF1553 domain-containing protein [Planctomycetota bacterium]REJ92855.1 MAG: DUF1553 domain-containing protein [Planctomycetota bacterium]REK28882.1 MAG: DUF1553 domain-containing protein [Planctomycetota bacterium]REK39684.1 MAG: DUF1553 domain-containing protein [Planctomycetota bacterium]